MPTNNLKLDGETNGSTAEARIVMDAELQAFLTNAASMAGEQTAGNSSGDVPKSTSRQDWSKVLKAIRL